MSPRSWEWSDAWLLASIVGASRSSAPISELARVLYLGDGINKTIFMINELTEGLARLRAAELVATNDLSPTGAGIVLHDRTEHEITAFGAVEHLECLLREIPIPEELQPAGDVTEAQLDAAHKEYGRWFEREFGRLDGGDGPS